MSQKRLHTLHGSSVCTDEREAVAELRLQIDQPAPSFLLVFCSPSYDLARLAEELRSAFHCPIYGCTSSGQIGTSGFQRLGIAATSFSSDELEVTSFHVRPLSECLAQSADVGRQVQAKLAQTAQGRKAFALCLTDGLSLAEERLASALYQSLGNVPIVGGSAGDDLAFERTFVLVDGQFVADAAAVLVFETSLPFAPFKFQHFVGSDRKLLITGAEPARRIVREINGEPAGDAYAEMLGLTRAELTPEVFTKHPLVLTVHGEPYVRSIQRLNPDGSMSFFCAMEEGLLLSVGEALDPGQTVDDAFARIRADVGAPEVIIGCDCILRRLEFEARSMATPIGEKYAANRVVGFSTYGEQFNALHVNQTFTGVAIGG